MEENDNRQIYSVRPNPFPTLSNLHPFQPTLITTPASGNSFWGVLTLRWSARKGSWPTGDPDLQHYVGELLCKGADPPTLLVAAH